MENLKSLQTYFDEPPYKRLTTRGKYDGFIRFGAKSPEIGRVNYIYISMGDEFFDVLQPIYINIHPEFGVIISQKRLQDFGHGIESYKVHDHALKNDTSKRITLKTELFEKIISHFQTKYQQLSDIDINEMLHIRLPFSFKKIDKSTNSWSLELNDYPGHVWVRIKKREGVNSSVSDIIRQKKRIKEEKTKSPKKAEKEKLELLLGDATMNDCVKRLEELTPEGMILKIDMSYSHSAGFNF